ncbi:sigma-54-dependent Fis family transcriptional regulator [Vandammella animalimorsus]|nr:sigma-54-dependent Fis family transcriptional regulator [Vandammella animalimorsus]
MGAMPFPARQRLAPAGADALLQQARHALQTGALPAEELLPPALAYVSRSWQRSVQAGLDAFARSTPAPHHSRFELARATERQHELLTHARPVMDYLMGQTREHRGMVILADADGLLLHALGDLHFLQRAERVALAPGASWHEAHRGTNAIGTALAEAAPVMVHGAEHFLECNGFLSCAAAPVRAPDGQVLGVLDFSGERRPASPQVLGMVCTAAHMIENRLFQARHGHQLRLHLHPLPEGLGTAAEGVLAISEQGMIAGANAAALQLLGLQAARLGQLHLQSLFQTDLEQLLRSAHAAQPLVLQRAAPGQPAQLHTRARLASPARRQDTACATPAQPGTSPQPSAQPSALPTPLQALDTGDTQWRNLLEQAAKVCDHPIAVLLHGESGTGKEVLARAIHQASGRAAQPLVAVNCAALPENLIEAELFGYAPGAFTGARREGAPGLIRQAHGGTLLLDEIGDMPLALQARLLRVLQERQVTPLGSGQPVAVDFALICASHRDLKAEVAAGRLRADLYWRINGLTLHLPPLRQRSDWHALAQRLLLQHAREQGRTTCPTLGDELAHALRHYPWPGNLRQLDSALRTAAVLAAGSPHIDWQHLPGDLQQELQRPPAPHTSPEPQPNGLPSSAQPMPEQPATSTMPLAQHTLLALQRAVAEAGGNISQAARNLGISRNTLYRHLKRQR